MRFDRNLAFILLAVYLILVGLIGIGLPLGSLSIVAAVLALAAGILMLIYR